MASTIRDENNNSVGDQTSYSPLRIIESSGKYQAQTFTPTSSYDITQLTVWLKKSAIAGREPGDSYIAEIRAARNTTPNSVVLLSKTFDASGVTTSPTAFDIVFDSTAQLQAGTKYSFVISKPTIVSPEELHIGLKLEVPGYSGGDWWRSTDGSNWINGGVEAGFSNGLDLSFGIWGVDTVPSTSTQFPESRPAGYGENQVWDPDGDGGVGGFTDDLADLTTLGGGRYGKQLIAVSGSGDIYFGGLG